MSGEQYFHANPSAASNEKVIHAELRGRDWSFITDSGVFSKQTVDFGTATLLETFEWPEVDGDIIDIGCGYGVVGVTLAKETTRSVLLFDINQRAVELANKNIQRCQAENAKAAESDLFSAYQGRAAAILTNPPIRAGKKVVHRLFEEAYEALSPGGECWVVIQKKQGAPSAKEKLNELFPVVKNVKKNKGYYIFRACK
ncbi:class I SAM-dependent methyltransferase [Marinococcus sp. PL1-022]|uniref:class I SAM-dependent methyltransferase n=1 Tax=Marinococcus sp. PL1-022 TaxID=3095363 RepID=UPI0029C41667|nr:methyltransferase [Marinococcus sp. PL1-022]MDX6151373.1 methyltransferase [Marinococcus sp. PL1-022]